MSAKLYSVDEVADLLGLHVRTVRGYVRDGRLNAVRIGKQYRIAESDLREFTGGASPQPQSPEVTVTAIVQIERAGRRVRDRISTHAIAAAGAGGPGGRGVDVHAVYDEPRDSLKVIVVGEAADTAAMITLVDAIARAQ